MTRTKSPAKQPARSASAARAPGRAVAEAKVKRAGHGVRRPRRNAGGAEGFDGEDTVDGQFISALARGLEVLKAFRRGEPEMGNTELAERTGIAKPTISRITHTLTKAGYLNFNARRMTYELGAEAISLGHIALSNLDVPRLAKPLMQSLANSSGFNVGLGMRDRHLMMYAETCEGKALVGLTLRPGSRIPIATSAMGRAYLAALPEDQRAELLAELAKRHGDEWPVLAKGIQRSAKQVEETGYCLSLGDWQKDINGVAVPIRFPSAQHCYAINLGGPAYLLKEDHIRRVLGPELVRVARQIEKGFALA